MSEKIANFPAKKSNCQLSTEDLEKIAGMLTLGFSDAMDAGREFTEEESLFAGAFTNIHEIILLRQRGQKNKRKGS